MGSLALLLALLIGFVGVAALILIAPFPAFALILALAAVWCWWLERHPLPSVSGSLRTRPRAIPIQEFLATIETSQPARVRGTAVFMTAQPKGTPPALAHNLRYNKVLHQRVVTLMSTDVAPV